MAKNEIIEQRVLFPLIGEKSRLAEISISNTMIYHSGHKIVSGGPRVFYLNKEEEISSILRSSRFKEYCKEQDIYVMAEFYNTGHCKITGKSYGLSLVIADKLTRLFNPLNNNQRIIATGIISNSHEVKAVSLFKDKLLLILKESNKGNLNYGDYFFIAKENLINISDSEKKLLSKLRNCGIIIYSVKDIADIESKIDLISKVSIPKVYIPVDNGGKLEMLIIYAVIIDQVNDYSISIPKEDVLYAYKTNIDNLIDYMKENFNTIEKNEGKHVLLSSQFTSNRDREYSFSIPDDNYQLGVLTAIMLARYNFYSQEPTKSIKKLFWFENFPFISQNKTRIHSKHKIIMIGSINTINHKIELNTSNKQFKCIIDIINKTKENYDLLFTTNNKKHSNDLDIKILHKSGLDIRAINHFLELQEQNIWRVPITSRIKIFNKIFNKIYYKIIFLIMIGYFLVIIYQFLTPPKARFNVEVFNCKEKTQQLDVIDPNCSPGFRFYMEAYQNDLFIYSYSINMENTVTQIIPNIPSNKYLALLANEKLFFPNENETQPWIPWKANSQSQLADTLYVVICKHPVSILLEPLKNNNVITETNLSQIVSHWSVILSGRCRTVTKKFIFSPPSKNKTE